MIATENKNGNNGKMAANGVELNALDAIFITATALRIRLRIAFLDLYFFKTEFCQKKIKYFTKKLPKNVCQKSLCQNVFIIIVNYNEHILTQAFLTNVFWQVFYRKMFNLFV